MLGKQLLNPDRCAAEAADRHDWTVDGERRDDHIYARAVIEARVAHRRRFIHASSHVGHDLVNDVPKVRCILENDAGKFEHSAPLDVNLAVGVYQNVGNGRILKERLEGPESKDFVQHLAADSLFFRAAERDVRGPNQVVDYVLYLRSRANVLQRSEFLEVNLVQ